MTSLILIPELSELNVGFFTFDLLKPKTLGISAIPFAVSGATCVIRAALENGLVQPF